jgi:hypothetical protein
MPDNNEREEFINNLDPEIADNLNKNYELLGNNYDASFAELATKDLLLVADNSGAKIIDGKRLAIKFFDDSIIIDIENKKAHEDGNSGPLDFFSSTLILHYLLNADGTPLFGEWIPYRELPGGLFYASTIPGVLQPLLMKYESDGDALVNRIVKLGGKTCDDFKNSGILYPFSRVPVLFILEEKDEEFDGTLRVLFDRSASRYLKTDIIKTLIVYMVKKLIA